MAAIAKGAVGVAAGFVENALAKAIPVAIGTLDALIVVFYLTATTLLGIWLGRGQKNNRDYFLAGHKLPTWSLLLSIVATETSTVTFLNPVFGSLPFTAPTISEANRMLSTGTTLVSRSMPG